MDAPAIEQAEDIVTYVEKILCQNCFDSVPGKLYYSDFYVGVTNSPERRFKEHKIRDGFCFVIVLAKTHKESCKAKNILLNKGMRSNPGCGRESSVYIYAYRMHHDSHESLKSTDILQNLFTPKQWNCIHAIILQDFPNFSGKLDH